MSIQIQDYISNERITEIVEEELRQKLRNLDIVRDYFKSLSYDILIRIIREECHIDEAELRELLAIRTKETIAGDKGTVKYEFFRRDFYTKKPESAGARLLDEIAEESRPIIVEAVNKAINEECMKEVRGIARTEALRIVREKISDVKIADWYREEEQRKQKEREEKRLKRKKVKSND